MDGRGTISTHLSAGFGKDEERKTGEHRRPLALAQVSDDASRRRAPEWNQGESSAPTPT